MFGIFVQRQEKVTYFLCNNIQNGATPGGLEVPRSLVVKDMLKKASELPKEHQPLIPTGADLKWRYMWRIGPRPSTTRFEV